MKRSDEHKFTNALISESSPYLLQHAHNPVNWYPWNEETLAKAKSENKMIIVSIGYAACHWCHVMEHESFEDSTVASIMNENFICIKVDREERPDVDDVYMTACQLASGRGCGWPLNAFALPDGRPVWAGTYFPKDQWTEILNQFINLNQNNPAKLEDSASRITKGIKSYETIEVANNDQSYSQEEFAFAANTFLDIIDFEEGGKKGAPKFPMPNNYDFLLHYLHLSGDVKAKDALSTTLINMARGGIFDQLGGGFARYSTDQFWLVPHFEKMLYDNGQLVSLYSKAYKLDPNPLYEKVVRKTTQFVERELMDESNGFYSSLDADSEGEEGKFYVWQSEEIDSILTNETERNIYRDYFSIKNQGNWEHTNILNVNPKFNPEKYNLNEDELAQIISRCSKLLMSHREKRIRPGLDDKILTGWNGLMLRGYIDAYQAFGDSHYKDIALKNANFILNKAFQSDGSLNRNYKNGKSTINAFLDDYASVIDAFLALYEITFDEKWIEYSSKLMGHVQDHFYNKSAKMYNYTSDLDKALIARKMELTDNVIPASNSMMARNLYKLGTLTYNNEMISSARQMLANIWPDISRAQQASFYSNWLQLYATNITPPYEIAVIGPEAEEKAAELQKNYFPNAIFLGGKTEGSLELLKDKLQEGRTMIYVCQNKVCKIPVEDVNKAVAFIN